MQPYRIVMYLCLLRWAVLCSSALSLCGAQECSMADYARIVSRVDALEARLQAAMEDGSMVGPEVPGVSVFPKGLRTTSDNPDRHVVARSESTWYTIANFLLAVDIDSPVSAIHLPQQRPAGGLENHFFMGDVNGKLHIFSMAGSILHEHQTDGASPITAISEGKFRSNATHVVTGHADGCVRWHLLEHASGARTDAPLAMHLQHGNSFCPNSTTPDPEASIKLVTLGKMYPKQRKLAAVAVTEANLLLMLREHGQPPVTAQSNSAIHNVQLENRQVRLLTEKGFSYVMLHSSNATVRAITCAGMNETRLVAAAADLQRPARAFGVSAAGELVALSLAGQNRISSCRVRFKRDVHMTMPAPNMAVLQAGALVTAANSLHLFNTTSSTKGARHAVLQQQLAQLPRSFGVFEVPQLSGAAAVSADAEGRVLIQLGDHMVALYHHPSTREVVPNPVDWIKWARPLMLLCMVTFGVYQFSRRGASHRGEAASARMTPELLRAQKQLYTNQRKMM